MDPSPRLRPVGPGSAPAARRPAGGPTPWRKPPRHRRGEAFLKGPIPYAWISAACKLPGAGFHVATAYRFLCGRYRRENRWGLDVVARGLQVSLDTARRGLHAAESTGLLVVTREPGCKLAVEYRELPEPGGRPIRKPLLGPIPWAWWLAALRLPGAAPHSAAACWLVAGWLRSADFELNLSDWSDLGLSRFSASRGVDALAGAGLVAVVERPGRPPLVSVLEAR